MASDLYKDITTVASNSHQENLQKLNIGEIDAILVDSVAAYYSVFSGTEKYYVLPESLGHEEYVIGFRKGDQALRDAIQEIIYQMKADGTLSEISKKWFRSDITTVR